jgi:hypothetical protein
MKKNIIIASLLLGTTNLFAQQTDSVLELKIEKIEQQVILLQKETRKNSLELDKDYWTYRGVKKETQKKLIRQERIIDSLNALIKNNSQNITSNSNQLGTEIQKVTTERNTQITALDDTIGENRLYWILGSLGTLLLGVLMYLFLGKRIKSSKTDVETQIRNTKQSLEEESIKLDNKLIDILETQLKVKQEESKAQPISSSVKEDHSLALKVADEVVRMQKNIAKMDSATKGIKPLSKGIERIQNNFAANGYEMINHMNKEYDERMNIDVINFITDENLSEGNRIITAIIKPQVNFNGVLIQRAQVDVSQN